MKRVALQVMLRYAELIMTTHTIINFEGTRVEPLVNPLKNLAKDLNAEILLVGGVVRDLISGQEAKDIDFVIRFKDGEQDIQRLEAWLRSHGISSGITNKEFQTIAAFQFCGEELDAVVPRKEEYNAYSRKPVVRAATLEEDVMRRDFCCNALYATLDGEVIDLTGRGVKDIQTKTLHLTGKPEVIFVDDPLRIFRAVRFKATKGYSIDEETWEAMKAHAKDFKLGVQVEGGEKLISFERAMDELVKCVKKASPSALKQVFIDLHNLGVLGQIFPALEGVWGYDQKNPHHDWTLEEHMLRTMEKAQEFALEANLTLDEHLGLVLGALLHDIAKPEVMTVDGVDGTHHFIGHEEASAKALMPMLNRLRFNSNVVEMAAFTVAHHMEIKPLKNKVTGEYQAKASTTRRKAAAFKDEKHDRDLTNLCLMLIKADDLSHSASVTTSNADGFLLALEEANKEVTVPRLKIDGNIVSERLGIPKSRALGVAIKRLYLLSYEEPALDADALIELYPTKSEDYWAKLENEQ